MAVLDMSYTDGTLDLVYDQPLDNELGRHNVAFPVGKVLYIDGSDNAVLTTTITEDLINSGIKAGTGDLSLALFRRGKSYTISASEETILDAAGYGDAIT